MQYSRLQLQFSSQSSKLVEVMCSCLRPSTDPLRGPCGILPDSDNQGDTLRKRDASFARPKYGAITNAPISTDANDEMSASPGPSKEPEHEAPREQPRSVWTRRSILFAFWAVVVTVGLPHWIWTTSIHRSNLPLASMNDWTEGKVCRRPTQ